MEKSKISLAILTLIVPLTLIFLTNYAMIYWDAVDNSSPFGGIILMLPIFMFGTPLISGIIVTAIAHKIFKKNTDLEEDYKKKMARNYGLTAFLINLILFIIFNKFNLLQGF